MITAKKAKEQIIKFISKRKYINKCKEAINKAIANYQFDCNVKIKANNSISTIINLNTISTIISMASATPPPLTLDPP